jgi:glycine cleavage system transcriptional repressor
VALLAVTVVGHDGPGIIAGVTEVLSDLGGNLEDSSMTLLRGHFAMTLIVDVNHAADEVESVLAPVTSPRGLLVTVRAVPVESMMESTGTQHVLRVHGGDRPGIVSALTSAVAARGGNITDLTTRLSSDLYVLIAEVDLPASADAAALGAELTGVARDLGVEASFDPVDADLL